MNLFDKCRKFDRAEEVHARGLMPYFHAISKTDHGTEVTMEGRRLLMMGSNNYLGLTHHPRVQEAALKAVRDFGTGCSGSRFLNGTLDLHHQLEGALADFFGAEAALVFSTGFQTNLGVLSVIAGKNDLIFCDRENHASIFDGARLCYGTLKKYRHNDLDELERLVADAPEEKGKLIVSDGIFSMLGDMADLPRLREIADRHGAALMIDDAHGVGVLGEGGRGTASHAGVNVELLTGTFSKSFGSLGGFAVGARQVIDFVKYTARAMIFSAAMTPSNAAAALAALDVIRTEPHHMARLRENVEYMRDGLRRMGLDIHSHPSAILPIVIGGDFETFATWRRLYEEGVFVNAVVSPAVQPGQGMLRTSYMATHTREQLDRCLAIFSRVLAEQHLVR